MFKKVFFLVLLILTVFTNTCLGFDDPEVPEDKYIVSVDIDTMPANIAFYYDTDADGTVDIIFYFPLVSPALNSAYSENPNPKRCKWKTYEEDFYPICESVIDHGDFWFVYMVAPTVSEQSVYMVIKKFTAYEYAATPSGNIQGAENTYKDIKEYDPSADPQYNELMDFTEAQ